MPEVTLELTLPQLIKLELDKKGMKQRFLYRKLIAEGVELSETKLSNRLNGIGPSFTKEEITAINKVLGTKFKMA